MNYFKEHVIDLLLWYYLIVIRDFILNNVIGRFIYLLNLTSALPMFKNIYKPLYQDNSLGGRVIGFFIRLVWGIVGLIISVLFIIPFIVALIILFILPFLPYIMVFFYLTKI